jgi:hypothetical protein
MYLRTNLPAHPVSPTQVWAGLTTECQARVIQLLARLASDLAAIQSLSLSTHRSPTDDDTHRLAEAPT